MAADPIETELKLKLRNWLIPALWGSNQMLNYGRKWRSHINFPLYQSPVFVAARHSDTADPSLQNSPPMICELGHLIYIRYTDGTWLILTRVINIIVYTSDLKVEVAIEWLWFLRSVAFCGTNECLCTLYYSYSSRVSLSGYLDLHHLKSHSIYDIIIWLRWLFCAFPCRTRNPETLGSACMH